jgi:2-C-methyl-D-erythritol 4-phosphate cytidylyltransferase
MIIERTIDTFERCKPIDEIILVSRPSLVESCEQICRKNHFKKIKKVIAGGNSRQESSCAAIASIDDEEAYVLIHDGVRPYLSQKIIAGCISALETNQAVTTAIPAVDTILRVSEMGDKIEHIPDRRRMMLAQTPQGFHLSLIKKAQQMFSERNMPPFSDDCGLVLHFNLAAVHVILGEQKNIKITFPCDVP